MADDFDAPITDAVLAAERQAAESVLHRLKADPNVPLTRDLTPLVLNRIRAAQGSSPAVRTNVMDFRRSLHGWLAAAAVVLLAIGFLVSRSQSETVPVAPAPPLASSSTTALAGALQWLARNQRPDGSWDLASLGGQKQHDAGATGLALMALLETGDFAKAARLATGHLLALQEAEGRFGPPCAAAMYNHGIATTALLKAYAQDPRPETEQALGRAVAFVLKAQTHAGGWGYQGTRAETPNSSVTAWQILALREAARLGWAEAGRFLSSSAGFVNGLVDVDGHVGYGAADSGPTGALSAAGAFCLLSHPDAKIKARGMAVFEQALRSLAVSAPQKSRIDPYAGFFLAEAARAAGGQDRAASPLAAFLQAIAKVQVRSGPGAGSFPAELDPRGAAGGSVCTTALAALSLRRL